MTKEETDKFTNDKLSSPDSKKDNSTSFFNRLKKQVSSITKTVNGEEDENKDTNITQKSDIVSEDELKRKEQEAKSRASKLENERKRFEQEQKKIEEEHKKKLAQRAEEERLEQERIAREKEEERRRIEEEKARKREEERLERERIAREKEEQRRRIEEEKARRREEERLERERIAREKEEERKRQLAEQAKQRREEFRRKDKEFQLAGNKRKIEFLEKENEKKEHENNLLNLQTSLIVLEDKISEKKLTISKLKNRKSAKEVIELEEKRLASIVAQRQNVVKEIAAEKKTIEKIQKTLDLDHKLDGLKNEIYNIKKEVVNEEETVFQVKYDNKLRNIFAVSIIYMKSFIERHLFRYKHDNYGEIKRASKNIKVRIVTSFILAIILSIFFLVVLKFISTAKEHYVSFDDLQTTAVDTTDEMKKEKEAEEKARVAAEQEKADAARIDSDAQDEEVTAKLGGTFVSYSFDVNREVTVSKKIHAFKSANWGDAGDTIEAGTKFTVNKLVSPAGYMMYQIASGDYAGQFITANDKFVTVDQKNDQFSNFVSNPVAIRFSATQNTYNDENLTSVKITMSSGAILNISGYGISNNRLIYHITDGSFVPVNPVSLTEVNRSTSNSRNINNSTSNSNSSNNQRNSTTQSTTQSNRSTQSSSSSSNNR